MSRLGSVSLRRVRPFLRGDDLPVEHREGGREIRLVGVLIVLGFVSSVAFHVVRGLAHGWAYPMNTFLFDPYWRFTDYFEPVMTAGLYGPPNGTNTVYSPFFHLLATGLAVLPDWVGLLLVMAVFATVLVLLVWHGVASHVGGRLARWVYTGIFCSLSYPVLFIVDRANFEMIVFVLLAAFLYLLLVKRSRWAWLPLALAIAGKYYPAVFIVFLVARREWAQGMLAALGATAISVCSAQVLAITSGFTFPQVIWNAISTVGEYGSFRGGLTHIQHGHSFWGFVIGLDRMTSYAIQKIGQFDGLYSVLGIGVLLFVCAQLLIYEFPDWKAVLVLVICATGIPHQSHDYNLIHVYLALALLGALGCRAPHGRLTAALLALLLVPMDYYLIVNDVSIAVMIYPVIQVALLVVTLGTGRVRRTVPLWRRVPVPIVELRGEAVPVVVAGGVAPVVNARLSEAE